MPQEPTPIEQVVTNWLNDVMEANELMRPVGCKLAKAALATMLANRLNGPELEHAAYQRLQQAHRWEEPGELREIRNRGVTVYVHPDNQQIDIKLGS
jgi:hypothetical protein